ncbi:thermonuclease family protein (plasmid) [Paracoccus sp. TOH]|nr:thermonuclease family protein [Paracoccus sp. TOH]WJS87334.1 thermonuclease family protein [Paracoccus sp. TOH]
MDAPEARQRCSHPDGSEWRCGREAAFALDELLRGRVLTCERRDQDRYQRVVAVCRIESIDIGEWMVLNGLVQDGHSIAARGLWCGQRSGKSCRRAVR